MAAILNSAMFKSTILDSGILVFPLKITHTCQDWMPLFAEKNFTHSFWLNLMKAAILNSAILQKKNFTYSFSLNLMMVAILNSAMLDSDTAILYSDTLLSSLRFTQKHSHSTLTLTQTNSIWLTRWWQPSWIQPFYKNLWFKLIQSDSNSFILTQLDDGCHLEFCLLGFCHCHLGFSHLSFYSHSHSHLPRLVDTICPKKTSLTLPSPPFAQKTSLIHSDSTWWW